MRKLDAQNLTLERAGKTGLAIEGPLRSIC